MSASPAHGLWPPAHQHIRDASEIAELSLPRILFVSTVTPNPNGRGIDRRAAQHLEALSRIGVIDLVLPDSEPDLHRARALNPAADSTKSSAAPALPSARYGCDAANRAARE